MIYYLFINILLMTTTLLGIIGLCLILLPVKNMMLKLVSFYKSVKYTTPSHLIPRLKSNIKDITLINVKPVNDTGDLLFESVYLNQRKFFILYLMSSANQHYIGYTLWEALMSQQLKYSPMKIFHAYENDRTEKILFSIANALEPGYFDSDHIEKIKTPGLCLFMHHQGVANPFRTFENMISVGKRLEHLLGGNLCDSERNPLSERMIQQYRHQLSSLFNEKILHV